MPCAVLRSVSCACLRRSDAIGWAWGSAGDKVPAIFAGSGATVDGNVRAGDVGRPRGRQESDEVGDLLRLGGPTKRGGLGRGVEQLSVGCVGVDGPRRDGVDAD